MYGLIENEDSGFFLWVVLLVAYSSLIYYLSSGPSPVVIPYFPHKDKVLHALVYGLLALLAWQVFRHWTVTCHRFWPWLYAVVFGATDEWHQYYVPGRDSSVWDWGADAAGAAVALLLVKILTTFWQNRAWEADTKAPY